MISFWPQASPAQEQQETYSISLVKTPETEKNIHKVGDKKVLTQTYSVQKGDWIAQVLRERGLLKQYKLYELLSVVKKLNASLENIDLIHPGEKIIIPIKIVPVAAHPERESLPPEKIPPDALKDINFENYTVKPGNSIIRIVNRRYDIPPRYLHSEYLDLIKKLNPSIKDLNMIYTGQTIRLPVYSPEVVRKPIETVTSPDTAIPPGPDQKPNPVAYDLAMIFLEMGEEWIQTGQHFIPLKSGGQIDLKATSFPIINLQSGQRIIVDLNNKLPDEMAKLIESSWGNYRIVHILENDDLRSALGKILRVCSYPKVFKKGEPLNLGGDIPLKITGDWIVTLPETGSHDRTTAVVINFIGAHTPDTPLIIKNYLSNLGIKIIDYPPKKDAFPEPMSKVETLGGGGDPSSLIETVLNLVGRPFSRHVEIPVYPGQKTGFKLLINADFFLKIKKKDAIIDLTGLDQKVIRFLKEHQFLVLSLADEKEPPAMVAGTLEFLGIQFHPGPHDFMAVARDNARNIKLTLHGIVFSDANRKAIFATSVPLPHEIAAFLSQRGYEILVLSSSSPSGAGD